MGQKLSPSALPRTNIANTHAHFLKKDDHTRRIIAIDDC